MDNTEEQAQSTHSPISDPVAPPSSSVVVDPLATPDPAPSEANESPAPTDILTDVASKIAEARNILIALSADPSVDEMAAAIGLSLYLDRVGKRATAIYSGATPNALEFLKPEDTFEATADTLQDFVIALNKEKADHLRYKLDGDFVKIFITPYRTRIAEEDLDFSYGDFNVDLVLALDVANGVDLDSALREHGRIMHDASIINITTGKPGKFGEIEWSDTSASSVSEMIASLLYAMGGKTQIEKAEATAFLTGIVAATNRFSNATTRPETMRLASRLMESGANQQLIAKNITPDVDNEIINMPSGLSFKSESDTDPTTLDIGHAGEAEVDESKVIDANVMEKDSNLLADLKAAEESLAHAGAEATPETHQDLFKIDEGEEGSVAEPVAEPEPAPESEVESEAEPEPVSEPEPIAEPETEEEVPDITKEPTLPEVQPLPNDAETTSTDSESTPSNTEDVSTDSGIEDHAEKVIAPSGDYGSSSIDDPEKYSHMLEEALTEVGGTNVASVNAPIVSPPDSMPADSLLSNPAPAPNPFPNMNPAIANTPTVPSAPDINGVPEMNYMPFPGEEVLPPPPAPPINMNPTGLESSSALPNTMAESSPTIATANPVIPPTPTNLGSQPAMTDQIYTPQASDPSAFKIPGA